MGKKRNVGDEIVEGMESALDYMRGKKTRAVVNKVYIPDKIDVKKIRKSLGFSRQEFADRYGFSVRTLQHWEQGNRHPHGPARILLLLLLREPTIIEKILRNSKKTKSHKNQIKAA